MANEMDAIDALKALDIAPSLHDAEDPKQVTSFMCSKFTALIDSVRAAEDGRANMEQRLAAMGARLKEAEARRRASDLRQQAALRASMEEASETGRKIRKVRSDADSVGEELQRTRRVVDGLTGHCASVEAKMQDLQRQIAEAEESATQTDKGWLAREVECTELRGEADRRATELQGLEMALASGREQALQRRALLRQLEEQLSGASRARQAGERRAAARIEELADAGRQALLVEERLKTADHALENRRDGAQHGARELAALKEELRKRETQANARGRDLACLGEVKSELAAALRDNVAVGARLEALRQFLQKTREVSNDLEARRVERQAALDVESERLQKAEAELEQEQRSLEAARASLEKARGQQAELEYEQGPTAARRSSLQEELKRVFASTEQLRAERDEAGAAAEQAQRKLAHVEPSLETARSKVRELETNIKESGINAEQAHRRKEALAAEVRQNRDKMRGLRRRREQLLEQQQSLEKRLLRTSRRLSFVPAVRAASAGASSRGAPSCSAPAGRATAARSPDASPLMASPTSAWSTGRACSAAPEVDALPAQAAVGERGGGSCSGDARPGRVAARNGQAGNGVGYLRQWVELEEARLNAPKPLSPPTSGTLQRQEAAAMHPPRSPNSRSAAALVALSAGAPVPEVLALALGGGAGAVGEVSADW